MKYFVTGATGFVGSYLTKLLVERGHEVVALVRHPDAARPLADLGVRLHEGDLTLKESMRKGMEGADGVFHLAAWYKIGLRNTSAAALVNVGGTINVLEL